MVTSFAVVDSVFKPISQSPGFPISISSTIKIQIAGWFLHFKYHYFVNYQLFFDSGFPDKTYCYILK